MNPTTPSVMRTGNTCFPKIQLAHFKIPEILSLVICSQLISAKVIDGKKGSVNKNILLKIFLINLKLIIIII